MAEAGKYTTIAGPATAEFRDRGSRFLAFAWPIRTVDACKERLAQLRKEHPKANHHCVAYRLGTDGNQYRASDDGEPSGSAGRPILAAIDSAGLTNVLIIVVRYFGGTLLGVPGLIHAYRTTAAMALESVAREQHWVEHMVEISFDYSAMGEVLYLLKQFEATVYKQDLQLFCLVHAGIPVVHEAACLARLSELRGVGVKAA